MMDRSGVNDASLQPVPRHWSGVLPHEQWLVRTMLRRLHDPPVSISLWNAAEFSTSAAAPVARLVLADRGALYRLLRNPDLQFGDLYSDGRIQVEGDLVAFLEAVYRSQSVDGTFTEYVRGRLGRHRLNTLARSRDSVYHHYDIGNTFYRLWLDDQMVYTCAYFHRPGDSLADAQAAKMEHVCRKLQLRPGQTVVEAGCGWGALAMYMARHHEVKVRAFNISREQIAFARERAAAEGLGSRVEFIEEDYRAISGTFDAFVSVGMVEHVGPRHYRELGAIINRCLAPSGRGLIHTIGRHRPLQVNPWIATRIFPGGYTPSLGEMSEIFEPNSLAIVDVENLRLHYAATIRHWLDRFEGCRDQVREMFDARFVRMWRLYLAGSLAAFTTGWMQLFQVVFARVTDNSVPLTREHLYRP